MSFVLKNLSSSDLIGSRLGEGIGEGYMQGSDERAIRGAIESLPENASYRDILTAISGVSTYNPEAKQQAASNLLKSHELQSADNRTNAQLEQQRQNTEAKAKAERDKLENAASRLQETTRHNQQMESIAQEKATGKQNKENEKTAAGKEEVKASLKIKGYPQALIEEYADALTPASARALEPYDKMEYERNRTKAENEAKPFAKRVEKIYEAEAESQEVMPRLKVAIANNEIYAPEEKTWDVLLDTLNSPFANMFKSKVGQELEAIAPIALGNIASKMGGVLTNAKIKIAEKKIAGIGRDKNANRLFLYADYYDHLLNKEIARRTQEVIQETEFGLPPADFSKRVNEKTLPLREQVARDIDTLLDDKIPKSWTSPTRERKPLAPGNIRIRNKTTGKTGQIPMSELSDYPDWEEDDATDLR